MRQLDRVVLCVVFSGLFCAGCATGITAMVSNYPPQVTVTIKCAEYESFEEAAKDIGFMAKLGWRPCMAGWKQHFPKPLSLICFEKPAEVNPVNNSVPRSPPPVSPPAPR